MRNEEAYQRFRGVIHDKIHRFIDEHLTVRIKLPDRVKPPQLDIKSVKPYDGDPSMEVLWDWLKSLVIHLKTQQLGSPDCDQEQKLIIEPVLTGKAKKWYHNHIIKVDSNKIWMFTLVILALYDRFIHDSMMQEARSKFKKATFAEGGAPLRDSRTY